MYLHDLFRTLLPL